GWPVPAVLPALVAYGDGPLRPRLRLSAQPLGPLSRLRRLTSAVWQADGVLIGLLADTHVPEAGSDLPTEVYQALAGCQRILHCGDLHTLDVVDRLDRLAPTLVSRGNGDTFGPWQGRPGVAD